MQKFVTCSGSGGGYAIWLRTLEQSFDEKVEIFKMGKEAALLLFSNRTVLVERRERKKFYSYPCR